MDGSGPNNIWNMISKHILGNIGEIFWETGFKITQKTSIVIQSHSLFCYLTDDNFLSVLYCNYVLFCIVSQTMLLAYEAAAYTCLDLQK